MSHLANTNTQPRGVSYNEYDDTILTLVLIHSNISKIKEYINNTTDEIMMNNYIKKLDRYLVLLDELIKNPHNTTEIQAMLMIYES